MQKQDLARVLEVSSITAFVQPRAFQLMTERPTHRFEWEAADGANPTRLRTGGGTPPPPVAAGAGDYGPWL